MSNRLHQGIILSFSSEPLDLPAAALKFLMRLRQMAGKLRYLKTRTKSLATIFGVTTNTIRNWRNDLVDGGWIHWILNTRDMWITVYIREAVETPSRQAALAEERRINDQPRPFRAPKPDQMPPRPWWKMPAISIFCLGGAKWFAPIKTRKIQELWKKSN